MQARATAAITVHERREPTQTAGLEQTLIEIGDVEIHNAFIDQLARRWKVRKYFRK